jgi:hypothetical protein
MPLAAEDTTAVVATLRDLADQLERGALGFPSLDYRADLDVTVPDGSRYVRERPTGWETFTLRAVRWARVRAAPGEVG